MSNEQDTRERPGDEGLELVWEDPVGVESKLVEWLWDQVFLKGNLNLVVGQPATGKSFFVTWMASIVSKGLPFPGEFKPAEQGHVLILSGEIPREVLAFRVRKTGGDKSKIGECHGTKTGQYLSFPRDLPKLRERLKSNPEISLLIIDPLQAFVDPPKFDAHRELSTRDLLNDFSVLAKETGITLIIVVNTNKVPCETALTRIAGYSAFNIARSIHLISKDRTGIRYFTSIKNNYAKDPKSLVWRITDEGCEVVIKEGDSWKR